MSALPEDIEQRLREEVAARGLALLELVRRGQRNTSVIEVVVDAIDRQVGLDELADLSRWTSALLDDVEGSIPGRYRLEVSSAGLSRPLEHRWQFQKNIGRLCKLTVASDGADTETRLVRILDVDESDLVVEPVAASRRSKKALAEPTRIEFGRIRKAVIEPEL